MGRLTRREDWPQRLQEFVGSRVASPFAWGSNDCVSFAAAAVERLTGTAVLAALGEPWTDSASAAVLLRAYAGGDLIEATAKLMAEFCCEEVPPLHAQRGDVVIGVSPSTGDASAMICLGAEIAGPGLKRLELLPLTDALRAWRIG